jgi:hypothetical protein
MKLKNIPFAEYLRMTPEEGYIYTYSFQFGNTLRRPFNHYKFKELQSYSFGQVKDCQSKFEKGITIIEIPEVLAIFVGNDSKYYQDNIYEVFQQFAWIKAEMEVISEAERVKLSRQPTDKEMRAGIENFEEFGVYPQFRALALTFNKDIDWVKSMPYDMAFLELCYQKELSDYELAFSKIKD